MTVETLNGKDINGVLLQKYFKNMINMYFKILPMYEGNDNTLKSYMESLRDELIGCGGVVHSVKEDPQYMSLIATLQYMIDGIENGDLDKSKVKKNVFHAINICGKISERYCSVNIEVDV